MCAASAKMRRPSANARCTIVPHGTPMPSRRASGVSKRRAAMNAPRYGATPRQRGWESAGTGAASIGQATARLSRASVQHVYCPETRFATRHDPWYNCNKSSVRSTTAVIDRAQPRLSTARIVVPSVPCSDRGRQAVFPEHMLWLVRVWAAQERPNIPAQRLRSALPNDGASSTSRTLPSVSSPWQRPAQGVVAWVLLARARDGLRTGLHRCPTICGHGRWVYGTNLLGGAFLRVPRPGTAQELCSSQPVVALTGMIDPTPMYF